MATVIAKNQTGSSVLIDDLGIEVPASDELNLSELFEFEDISSSSDLKSLVNNDTFIINDGTVDLSKSNSLLHIYHQTVYEDSFEDGGGSGTNADLSTIQIRRTTGISLSTSWQDVNFNITDIENNTTTLEHDNTNTDRVLIKSDGFYFISYSFTARSSGSTRDCLSRIRVNDSNLLDGSDILQNLYKNETHQQDTSFIVELNDGDFISLQVSASSTPIQTYGDYVLNIFKLDGVKGDKGDDGSTGADGADGADGVGTGIDVACLQVRQSTQFTTSSSWTDIEFDETDIESHPTILQHDNTNNERIIFKESGYYSISLNIITEGGELRSKFLLNGTTEINGSVGHQDPSSSDEDGIFTSFIIQILNDNDYITLQLQGGSSVDVHYCHVTALKLQGAKGDQGDQGNDGARGEAFSVDEYDDLDEAKVTWIEGSSGASSSDVYFIVVVDDDRSNQSLPAAISGDMTGHILMYDGTIWNDFGQFTGVAGVAGDDGHGWFSGATNPTSGMYENEDHYLNTTSGEIFKKTSGTWNNIGDLSGPQGIQGNDGSDGNSIKIQNDGSDIMSNVAIINFTGDMDITTSSGSKVNIDINSQKICMVRHSDNSININNSSPVSLPFPSHGLIDSIYTHNTSSNNSRIYTDVSGWYKISYNLSYDSTSSSRRNVHSYLRKNGTTNINYTNSYSYTRNTTDDKATNSITTMIELEEDDYIELMSVREGSSGTANSLEDECWLIIELIRED